MDNEFGLKELYDVFIKTTLPIEINGKHLAEREVIAAFDKIQIANINEIRKYITAHGGYEDRDQVWWEPTKGVDIVFTQGIFSSQQLAIMINAKMAKLSDSESLIMHERETVETDGGGVLTLTRTPRNTHIFIYNKETGEKILNATMVNEKSIRTSSPYTDMIVDYEYLYDSGASYITIGTRTLPGYLTLEGKTRVKDDITGATKTGILWIPKLKLTSDLSLILGTNANPQVGRFEARAVPTGPHGETTAMELYFLNNDVDIDTEK